MANHACGSCIFSVCTVLPDRVEVAYVCDVQAVTRDVESPAVGGRSCDGIKEGAPPNLAHDWAPAHKEQNSTFTVLGD